MQVAVFNPKRPMQHTAPRLTFRGDDPNDPNNNNAAPKYAGTQFEKHVAHRKKLIQTYQKVLTATQAHLGALVKLSDAMKKLMDTADKNPNMSAAEKQKVDQELIMDTIVLEKGYFESVDQMKRFAELLQSERDGGNPPPSDD